jgi:hypothetical protein
MVTAMIIGFILVGAYTYKSPFGFMLLKYQFDIFILLKLLTVGVISSWLGGVVALCAPRLVDWFSIGAGRAISVVTVFLITSFIVTFLATGIIIILLKRMH